MNIPRLSPIAQAVGFQPEAMLSNLRSVPKLASCNTISITTRTTYDTPVTPVTLAAAVDGATLLTASEVETVAGPTRKALESFRIGQATHTDWVVLCTAVNVGTAIERQGVVRGLMDEMDRAYDALNAIGNRMGTLESNWKTGPLYAAELATLRDLVRLHRFQLEQLSGSELERARKYALARVQSAGGIAYPNAAAISAGRANSGKASKGERT